MSEETDKIRSVLEGDILSLVKIAGVIGTFFLFVWLPVRDLKEETALIRNDVNRLATNDYPHIQAATEQQARDIVQMKLDIQKILTILSK